MLFFQVSLYDRVSFGTITKCVDYIYVTRFAKTVPINWHNNWNPIYSLTLMLHSSTVQAHQAYGYRYSHVCFHWWLFSSMSNREGAPQGLWSQWMALIRMCMVPNCSQRLSRPILWIVTACVTYWTHSTAACFLNGRLNLPLAAHPHPPSTPLYVPFVILQSLWKKLLKIQQC